MQKDTLYLACTRGANGIGGLPIGAWMGTFYFCYVGYMTVGGADIIHFRGYVWILSGFLIPVLLRFAVERDPNIFRILRLLVDTYSIRSVLWSSPQRFSRKSRMASAI